MKYALTLFFFLAGWMTLSAATLTVTNNNDTGAGSLRFMVSNASNGDVIVFAPALSGTTITLNTGITLDKELTIDGSGLPQMLTITCIKGRAIKSSLSNTVIRKLKFADCKEGAIDGVGLVSNSYFINNSADYGGACSNIKKIENCDFHRNSATKAGGACYYIFRGNPPFFSISDSRFYGNTSLVYGGGLACSTQVFVNSCFFEGNSAVEGGASVGGNFDRCTFIKNNATVGGGALSSLYSPPNYYPSSYVFNCTFAYNKAKNGGAINGGLDYVYATTFINNEALDSGGGINGGFRYLSSSIIANNTAGNTGMDFLGNASISSGNLIGVGGGAKIDTIKNKLGSISNPLNPLLSDSVRCGNNLYFRLNTNSPAMKYGNESIFDTLRYDSLKRKMCYDICGNPRPSTCIDAGSYQQSTCTHTKLAGGCQPNSRNPLSTFMAPLEVYPNPTSGVITLRLSEPKNGAAELYDLTGRMILRNVLTTDSTELNLEDVSSGVYTLKVTVGNEVKVVKVVRE